MGSAFAGNVLTVNPCSPFRGIVQSASQLWAKTVIESPTPMKVLVLNGDADGLIPFEGGPSNVGATFLSFGDTLSAWAKHNGCGDAAPSITETSDFIRFEYACVEPVVGYQLKGMGHGTSIQSWYSQGPLHLAMSIFGD